MGRGIPVKIKNLTYVSVVIAIFSNYAGYAEAIGKARVSLSLAQTVCASAVKFATTNQIEPPSKSPPSNDDPCKSLKWSNCGPTSSGSCQKFRLKNCNKITQGYFHKDTKTTRIVNGVDAIPHEFPHIVRITADGDQHCGGTILNENIIVTAAHCIYRYYYPSMTTSHKLEITAGEHNIKVNEGAEQIRKIKKFVWHENFVLNSTYLALNDIALVLLDEPLQFTENVFPPNMPEPDYEAAGLLGTMMGWGELYFDGALPDILQKVNLTIISDAECAVQYAHIVSIPETVVCARSVEVSFNNNTCLGDSGGPLTLKVNNDCDDDNNGASYLFVGIASYNANCNGPYSSVYSQVSKYIDWININAAWLTKGVE